MKPNNQITVRPVALVDRKAWGELYEGYAKFYKLSQTESQRDVVWSWLHDLEQQSEGLVAVDSTKKLVGLTHFRAFSRPLTASTGGFLDDLFVSDAERGLGVADLLIEGVRKIAEERSWSVVRWITAEDNYRGRGVYDRVASQTKWVTYDIEL